MRCNLWVVQNGILLSTISRKWHCLLLKLKFCILDPLKVGKCFFQDLLFSQIIHEDLNFALSSRKLSSISLSYSTNTRTDCSKGGILNLDCKENNQTNVGYYAYVTCGLNLKGPVKEALVTCEEHFWWCLHRVCVPWMQ